MSASADKLDQPDAAVSALAHDLWAVDPVQAMPPCFGQPRLSGHGVPQKLRVWRSCPDACRGTCEHPWQAPGRLLSRWRLAHLRFVHRHGVFLASEMCRLR